MGNLVVFPGSHHIIAKAMNKEGPFWTYDSGKGGKSNAQNHPKIVDLANK